MPPKTYNMPPEFNININSKVFNEKYFPHLMTIHEYEVYYGGQGSGKSWFIAQKKMLQLTIMKGRNMICLRRQSTDCFDSCWGMMLTAMRQLKLEQFWVILRGEHRLVNKINGNCIYFDGVDKIDNIKSFKPEFGNLTDVWYEEVSEEEEKSNIDIIDGRIRDEFLDCSLILSFNPTYRTHWLFNYVLKEIKTKDSIVIHSTHWDNKFLSQAYHQKTEALQYTDPYRYMVYAKGEWGVTGQTVFNANKIQARLDKLRDIHMINPPIRMEIAFERDDNGLPNKDSFMPFKHPDGEIWIYKPPHPKHPYVFPIDTAGEGVDWFAGHVIDNITGEQVAVFHSVRDPDVCALQIIGLAMYYNRALIVPEINFDGSYLLNKCVELKYHELYQRERPKDSYSAGYEPKLGWRTTSENRPRMLADFKEWTEEHMDCINDIATLNEMLTFTRQAKKMKGIWWGAEAGAHDDLVMSFAIGLQGRIQQLCVEIAERKTLKGIFYPEELDMGIRDKTFSREDVFEYKKKHSIFGEKYELKKRSNRYVR